MVPLAIWVLLIGYTVLWTGKMNLGISYQPQTDSTIKPVGPDGKPAHTYSLMDAVTCATPSTPVPGTGQPTSVPRTPSPVTFPPVPQLSPSLANRPIQSLLPKVPTLKPQPFTGTVHWFDGLSHFVYSGLNPVIEGARSLIP